MVGTHPVTFDPDSPLTVLTVADSGNEVLDRAALFSCSKKKKKNKEQTSVIGVFQTRQTSLRNIPTEKKQLFTLISNCGTDKKQWQ